MINNAILLEEFKEFLSEQMLSERTKQMYYSAVECFTREVSDFNDINAYNDFLFEHTIKRRSTYFYDALKWFIKFHISGQLQQLKMQRDLIKPKKNDPKIIRRSLDESAIKSIIANIKDEKHRVMAMIQENTGARAGDILKLKKGNITFEEYEEKVLIRLDFEGKGGKRYVKWVFNDELKEVLENFIKNNLVDLEYYFLRQDKSRPNSPFAVVIKTNYIWYWSDLKQATETMGYDVKDWATHDFRRNFARRVWNKTKDAVVLKDALNHTDFNTTLRYLRNSGLTTKDLMKDLEENR